MISDVDIFLSLPNYINVLRSSHTAWVFFSEIMFYGYLPWESIAAATVANWRSVVTIAQKLQPCDLLTDYYQI